MTKTIEIGNLTYAIIRSSPVIEAPSSKGGKKYWQGHIVEEDDRYFTCSSSWQTLNDGGVSKTNWSIPYFAEPTNVGRSNERNNHDQAQFELDSMIAKQHDKRSGTRPLPMLAAVFIHPNEPKKSRKHKISYPAFVQPKFDGMCVLYNGDEAWTRQNKDVLPEVFAHLQFDTQGETVHGELLHPDNIVVGDVMKLTKKFRAGETDKLIYVVYDLVDTDLPQSMRLDKLSKIVAAAKNPNVHFATTVIVGGEQDVRNQHEKNVKAGYEGSIIRNMHGKYKVNKRVDDVQKFKDFITEEFRIVDVVEAGDGSSKGMGKFVCVTENGDRFFSTSKGKQETRREYLTNKDQYIGRWAVVKYREMTEANNVPFHSNVLEIRETKEGGY